MNLQVNKLAKLKTECANCPLRKQEVFREFAAGQLDFVADFKVGELNCDRGTTILAEGASSAHLYTVLGGWGFRYKTMEDGRRQILNYVLPGDMVGLQGGIMGEMQHSIEALSDMSLCVFERVRLMELFQKHPDLAYDLTWLAAREERILDEHLLSVGRRTALERVAYLLAHLYARASSVGLGKGDEVAMPITQQHVADTLGFSIVHTNKTLRKLANRGFLKWLDRGCLVRNSEGLAELASWEGGLSSRRPLI